MNHNAMSRSTTKSIALEDEGLSVGMPRFFILLVGSPLIGVFSRGAISDLEGLVVRVLDG